MNRNLQMEIHANTFWNFQQHSTCDRSVRATLVAMQLISPGLLLTNTQIDRNHSHEFKNITRSIRTNPLLKAKSSIRM